MSTESIPYGESQAPTLLPGAEVHRFTVEQYHRMISTGVLAEDDRVELLEGYVVQMSPIGPPHATAVQRTFRSLFMLPLSGWHVRCQQPITLSASEPEPDVTVVRGAIEDYSDHHPGPRDVGLAIEVSDASLEMDRERKLRLYAAEGLAEYWIVDLTNRRIERYRTPKRSPKSPGAAFEFHETVRYDARVPLTLDGKVVGEIAVAELLP